MERPPESLKSFADRIAKVAATEDATQIVRLLRIAGLTGGVTNNPAAHPIVGDVPNAVYVSEPQVPPKESRHIGIWERRTENGKPCFIRRLETMDEWHFWANLGRIDAKGPKRRVLFLGESVARGYLYDPDFTPALALQMILEAQFGKDQVEIIDLARTNLGYEVRELALAALQLEPDIAIIFGGNNWGFSLPTFANIAEIDQAITTDGMAGVKRVCDEYIARTVRFIASDIASEYKKSGVPLVWIIPEFNLGDWRDPFTNAPYLPGDLNQEWITALKEARKAMSEGDAVTAEKLAARTVEIDQGTCTAGFYILADCRRLENDIEGERKYLERARDAQSWDSSMMFIPRPYSISQEILRDEMSKHDCQVVDLPVLFKQYLNGEIPGRRMFLDYCHMTTEGIQVAMGAAASCVLRALKGVELPWYALVGDHIAPSRETESEANFLAAIHDAHRYQGYDMVRHFCSRALELSPHIAELMLNYIDLQIRNSAPLRMSEAELQIFHLGSPLIHRYLFRNNDKRLDKLLLSAIVEVLEKAGIAADERLKQLHREEHSARLGEINLLHYYYCQAAGQPQELEALMWPFTRMDYDPRYYRAYWPESRFVFVGEAGHAVNLCLTCRLPEFAPREATISVECNGKPQVEITIAREWSSWEISLPGQVVRDDLNEIEVRWPMPEFRADEALGKVIMRLCQKKYPEFYPIFGEISSFTASAGLEVPADIPLSQVAMAGVEVS
jgi:hypothetical protein